MNISETITALKVQLYDRATSPLWGAFLLSWGLWNYRFLMLILSSMPLERKFEIIDSTLFPTWVEIVGKGICWPLFSAAALIYLYPIPAKKVFEHWRKEQRNLKAIQKEIDDQTPLTREDEKAIRESIIQQELSFAKERTDREAEVRRLRDLAANLQAQLEESAKTRPPAIASTLPPSVNYPSEQAEPSGTAKDEEPDEGRYGDGQDALPDHLLKTLRFFSKGVGTANVATAANSLAVSQMRAEAFAEDLVGRGLLQYVGSGQGGTIFKLSPAGRKFIVAHDLDR